jgi:hypothetical protein
MINRNRRIFVGLNNGVCLYNPITMNMTCQCCGLTTGRSLDIELLNL